jgi:hypothetical protein
MTEEHNEDGREEAELRTIDPDEIPEGATALQDGHVIGEDSEMIGRIDVEAQRERAVEQLSKSVEENGGKEW